MVPTQTTEVRCAVRFPIRLPVSVFIGQGEREAWTKNISAGGVLLELDYSLLVGDSVEFAMKMPAAVLGTPNDVVVHCEGRVVRSSASPPGYQVAAVIDQYRFKD